MSQPLEGIEILDLGTLTPGKYCTFLLADLGASVLRVERPQGGAKSISDEDLILNRGKRSMTLNLREESGREILDRNVERADIVIESNRPGVAARIGIDYERLKKHNGRMIYCSLSGFGQAGFDTRRDAPTPAPAVGARTDLVLHELGFDPRRVSRLRDAGII